MIGRTARFMQAEPQKDANYRVPGQQRTYSGNVILPGTTEGKEFSADTLAALIEEVAHWMVAKKAHLNSPADLRVDIRGGLERQKWWLVPIEGGHVIAARCQDIPIIIK